MRRYDSYKPSGVSWIGDVPTHWEVRPGFTCYDENKDRNKRLTEKTVLSLSYGRIVVKPEEKMTGLVPESFDTYQLIKPGDIVIRTTDLQNDKTSLRVGMARDKGMITSAYLGLRCKPEMNPEYVFRLLESYDAMKVFYGMGSGLRQNIDFWDFKRLPVPVPPRKEQDRIVTFLDQKTAEIDAAIAKKERLIELLHDQKSVLIRQAVSRGLQLNVAMQDSGIPWLGEVPSHWQVLPIRRIAKTVKTGRTPPSDSKFDGFVEGSISWFSPGDFREDGAFESSSRLVNQRAARLGHVEVFAPNSIYFIGIGATLGKACVSKLPASCNQQVNVISLLENHDPDFFACQLNSIRPNVFGLAEFTTLPILNQMGTKRIRVAIPPSEEQKEIVGHLNQISETYKSAIEAQQRLISNLREMRSISIAESIKGSIWI